MRVFLSTGEASGELLAADLLEAMRARGVAIDAEGIGDERMARAGVRLWHRTRGWASMGPIEAIRRIPKLLAIVLISAMRLRLDPPDLVVLVDFGAFNLRFAGALRRLGARMPILYYFPPAAWLDDPRRARSVAARTDALTAFAHQRDFYRSLRLPIAYTGHPIASTLATRPPRSLAPPDGGVVALMPGSRQSELTRHTALLLDAFALVVRRRPHARAVFAAADEYAQRFIATACAARPELATRVARDARSVLADADAAAIASGTAVLEAALIGTPTAVLYVLSAAQAKIARRVYRGRFIALPNLLLDEPLVPELLQEDATPAALAAALLQLLDAPQEQVAGFARVRTALGPPDALDRSAAFALALAGHA